jgi:hypothetical protein
VLRFYNNVLCLDAVPGVTGDTPAFVNTPGWVKVAAIESVSNQS